MAKNGINMSIKELKGKPFGINRQSTSEELIIWKSNKKEII